MKTIRKKIIDLLDEFPVQMEWHDNADLANFLLSHGVTVQEWISVKDRLPKPFVSVLVQMPGEEPFPTVREGFISKDGIWHSALYDREPDEVTHWQPMPQPPKGE